MDGWGHGWGDEGVQRCFRFQGLNTIGVKYLESLSSSSIENKAVLGGTSTGNRFTIKHPVVGNWLREVVGNW